MARLAKDGNRPPILIAGATGTLGQALGRGVSPRDVPFTSLTGRRTLDLHDREAIERTLDDVAPWAVINAAGWVRVDDAEDEPERVRRHQHHGGSGTCRNPARGGRLRRSISRATWCSTASGREPYREERAQPAQRLWPVPRPRWKPGSAGSTGAIW